MGSGRLPQVPDSCTTRLLFVASSPAACLHAFHLQFAARLQQLRLSRASLPVPLRQDAGGAAEDDEAPPDSPGLGGVNAVQWKADGSLAATAGWDRRLRCLTPTRPPLLVRAAADDDSGEQQEAQQPALVLHAVLRFHTAAIACLAFSPVQRTEGGRGSASASSSVARPAVLASALSASSRLAAMPSTCRLLSPLPSALLATGGEDARIAVWRV